MCRHPFRIGLILIGIMLLLVPVSLTGQEPPNPLSAPKVENTYDRNWKIFNIVTLGEKSCVTLETLSQYISRCFDSPSLSVSDTVPLPNGSIGGEMYMTRVSVGNGVECLITTSSSNDWNGSISCTNDIHVSP